VATEGGAPAAFEAWNDYDPSMRFITAYPVSAAQGTEASTVAYYEFEPGRHSGLHSDSAEEVIYVADGEGEVFVSGRQVKLEAGEFQFVPANVQHDVYAYGAGPLRLLSFFPAARVESTFTEIVLPFGGHVIASDLPPGPQFEEISFGDLPPELAQDMLGFGLGGSDEPAVSDEAAADPEQERTE
jgi:quercetin dioxygenase-like cupin family protein